VPRQEHVDELQQFFARRIVPRLPLPSRNHQPGGGLYHFFSLSLREPS
jgi:hypothetical protein